MGRVRCAHQRRQRTLVPTLRTRVISHSVAIAGCATRYWDIAIKNGRESFLTSRSDGPKGGRQGWQAIKNYRELFLTSRSDGPKGGRQGWQAIKILFRTLEKSAPSGPAAFKLRLPDAFCRISESAVFPRVGAIRSCRMAAMPSPDQSLQSFTSPASQCRCSLSGEPRCPFSTTRCNAPISTR